MSKIKNPRIIRLTNFKDFRGKLSRVFCTESLKKKKLSFNIKQINHVLVKKKATIKGMHIQLQPFNEIKLVKVIKGKIFDVVLDLRKNSKNFLKYKVFILDSSTNNLLIIPKGFAHGFIVLSKFAIVSYKVDNYYSPLHESGIIYNDNNLNIDWKFESDKLIVSEKDLKLDTLVNYTKKI